MHVTVMGALTKTSASGEAATALAALQTALFLDTTLESPESAPVEKAKTLLSLTAVRALLLISLD